MIQMAVEATNEYVWQHDANCQDIDPGTFLANGLDRNMTTAKKFCGACVVRFECLADAIVYAEQDYIAGGLTPGEREGMFRGLCLPAVLQELNTV